MAILERDLNLFISGLLSIVLLHYSRPKVSITDMYQVPSAIGISLYKFELRFMDILLCIHSLDSVISVLRLFLVIINHIFPSLCES